MSGICGAIQVAGEPRHVLPAEVLDAMVDTMAHRGSAAREARREPGAALAARLLRSPPAQPAFSGPDGRIWAALDGTIYDHDRAHEDAGLERVRDLYERRGPGFQADLRGEFALVVWDAGRRRAVLARDRQGVKPLYWAQVDDLVVFASELKALLASGLVGAELDYEAIDAYLGFGFVPGPRTLLAGVSKLPPGHRLVVDESGVRLERYWHYPAPAVQSPPLSPAEYAARLREELRESVALRTRGDSPVGAMLSGGLDSTLVVALMSEVAAVPVHTFSVGFAEAGPANELADARFVADHFGTEHHELELSFAHDTVAIEELVWHLDEPLADLSSLGLIALSGLAGDHVSVALSGVGADGLLGGFPAHRGAALQRYWDRLPGPARNLGAEALRRRSAQWARRSRVLQARDPVSRFLATQERFEAGLRERLARGPLAEHDGQAVRRVVRSRLGDLDADPLATYIFLDEQLSATDGLLHYMDRGGMARGVEIRPPVLDHHVVEFCATIPGRLKVRRMESKHILRQAARGLVPERILEKRKVGFFNAAVNAWLDAQMGAAIERYVLEPAPRYAEFLDRDVVATLVAERAAGAQRRGSLVLSILMLEVWLSSFLPRALAGEPSRSAGASV